MKATKKQRKHLGEYVRWMANELELRDWTVTVSRESPVNPEYAATVDCTYGRKCLTIKFCENFLTSHTPEQQRSTVCHELIHAHFKAIQWAYNNLQTELSPSAYRMGWEGINDQLEFGIDAMADAVAKHLPLPKWAEGKAK